MPSYRRESRKLRSLVWEALALLLMVSSLLHGAAGSAKVLLLMDSHAAVKTPPVRLEAGIAGTNVIYANETGAKVSTVAPAPIPAYFANGYNVATGTYISGVTPASVETVDTDYFVVRTAWTSTSTPAYSPSGYNLLGSTTLVSGSMTDVGSNNEVYMTFRTYASATTAQTLYSHQDQTSIGGTYYYLEKLDSSDAAGTSLSTSMASTGRQLMGRYVYQLTGVSSLAASTWTVYYRTWQTSDNIAFDASGSGNNGAGSTSISWSHTTGSGSNRIMIVGVSLRTTSVSVSGITYGAQSLAFVRADTHASATIRSELWYLIAPASGTATVTVNLSGTSKAVGGSCTYTGVDQTSPVDANGGGTGMSGSPSQSVTVSNANSWLLGHLAITGSGTTVQSEGGSQTQRWDGVTSGGNAATRNRGHGSDKGPVGIGSQSVSWTLSASADWSVSMVALKSAFSAVGHADIDIIVRQSDGTVRQTVATDVAASANLPTTATTLSGTYAWPTYTVLNQTDYLEIDYYTHVTSASSAVTAYLRIDDSTLATADQTRATNIYLPSEFTSEVEFSGSSNTEDWYQLVWTLDSAWTAGSVTVTIQLYNYTLGGYPISGNGYDSYTSSSTANTDETKTQTITTNPSHFRDGSGNWKIKVKGVKTTTTQFDFKADWVEYKPSYYSEYTVSTEFLFSSMTANTPTQLNFTVVSEYSLSSVSVTVQVWNYSSSAYVIGGEGYSAYVSSGSNETTLLSINTAPQFYTSSGNAKIKLTGILTTTTQYQQKANQVKLVYSYDSSPNYDYVLKITNNETNSWKIRLLAYSESNIGRLINCTIYFRNATGGDISRQVYIESGSYVNQTGSWNDLLASPSERYIVVTIDAGNSQVSYVNVYLEILVPDKTTYARYVLTFEVT